MGYMASGKSTVGRVVAEKLNRDFIDLDDYIAAKEGMRIPELFEAKGEVFFRKKELECLKELLENQSEFVLALGGGTPTLNGAIEMIDSLSFSVYLKASIKELLERLKPDRLERPLLMNISDDFLQEYIAVHLFERNAFYQQAKMTLVIDGKTVEKIAEEIVEKLKLL